MSWTKLWTFPWLLRPINKTSFFFFFFFVAACCVVRLSLVGADGRPSPLLRRSVHSGAILSSLFLPPGAHLWSSVEKQSRLRVRGSLQGSTWVILGYSAVTERCQLCDAQNSNPRPSRITRMRHRHANHSDTASSNFIISVISSFMICNGKSIHALYVHLQSDDLRIPLNNDNYWFAPK